jgi:hypothetical protein
MELIHRFRLGLKKQATTAAFVLRAGAYPLPFSFLLYLFQSLNTSSQSGRLRFGWKSAPCFLTASDFMGLTLSAATSEALGHRIFLDIWASSNLLGYHHQTIDFAGARIDHRTHGGRGQERPESLPSCILSLPNYLLFPSHHAVSTISEYSDLSNGCIFTGSDVPLCPNVLRPAVCILMVMEF